MKLSPLALLAALVCLAGGVWLYGRGQRSLGRQEGLLAQREARVDTLRTEVVRLDTVVREKVRTFNHFDTLYRNTTDTVTVVRGETTTVYVNREIADNALNACRQSVLAFTGACAKKDTLIAAQDSVIASLKALKGKRCKLGLGPAIGGGWDYRGRPTVMAGVVFGAVC